MPEYGKFAKMQWSLAADPKCFGGSVTDPPVDSMGGLLEEKGQKKKRKRKKKKKEKKEKGQASYNPPSQPYPRGSGLGTTWFRSCEETDGCQPHHDAQLSFAA